jgi:sulfatase-like protein
MGTRRSPLLIPLTILAALLAAPLALIHAPYRPLYPALLVAGALAWMYFGRALRLALFAIVVAIGPLLWRLMDEGGAAELAAIVADTGFAGAMAYLRQFVLDGTPRLAWLLLACAVLLGFTVGAIVRRVAGTSGIEGSTSRTRVALLVVALAALALGVPRVKLRLWEARNAWRLAHRARDDDTSFLARVHSGVATLDRSPLVHRADVDVVLYVGASSRWDWSLYGYPRATNAALARLATSDRFVAFTDAVAPPNVGEAPSPDGLSSLDFLTRRVGEHVVPLAHVLGRAGVAITWLGTSGTRWSYDDALTGATRRTDPAWRYDGDLIAPLREALRRPESRLVVLDTRAGRFPWCDGVPSSQRVPWNDWMAHLPNAAIWGHAAPRRAALDCYDSAIAYTSTLLGDAMRAVDEASRPTILIYVASRGDDAWGQPGRYGAAHGARETDVPIVAYANAHFAERFPDALTNARRNRDQPVATAWVYDAVLDAFDVDSAGLTALGDRRLSMLGGHYDPRVADAASFATRGIARELARRARLASDSSGHLCTHRGNSLFKYLEGKATYGCVELDVVLDTSARGDGPAFVYHPPVVNPGLPLYELLAHAGVPPLGLWLDTKNVAERNAPPFLTRLSTLVPSNLRGRVLVESSNDALARSPITRAFGDSGFVLSYYLPTELGCACARSIAGDCAREIARLSTALRGGNFRGLSFDARGRLLARTLRAHLAPTPVLNTWTPMDACSDGTPARPLNLPARDTLLHEVQKYLERMPSPFDY